MSHLSDYSVLAVSVGGWIVEGVEADVGALADLLATHGTVFSPPPLPATSTPHHATFSRMKKPALL